MPRWLWFLPLSVITLLLGLWGFRLGWIAATLTETDVINRYAQIYLEARARDGSGSEASVADCVAYPGDAPGVWLVVSCTPDPADPSRRYDYAVGRFGGLQAPGGLWRRNEAPGIVQGLPET